MRTFFLLCLMAGWNFSLSGQEVLIQRWTFTDTLNMPDSVHSGIAPRPVLFSPAVPADCDGCPYLTPGSPGPGPAYGSHGWPDDEQPDLDKYLTFTIVNTTNNPIDLRRIKMQLHRESQGPQKWVARHSKNGYAVNFASGTLQQPNQWHSVNLSLDNLQILRAVSDSVTFRLYPYQAKKGPQIEKNTIWRIDSLLVFTAEAPLPVELIHFSASSQDEKILLTWKTASEVNSERFDIEHAGSDGRFARVGTVPAAGWSTAPLAYSWTHHPPSPGVQYYRLRQVDRDGTASYSAVVSAQSNGTPTTPFQAYWDGQYWQITDLNNLKGGNLRLFDPAGRLLREEEIQPGPGTVRLLPENPQASPVVIIQWIPRTGPSEVVRALR